MSTVVIGIGNPDRGDDALGLRVIEALRESPPAGAQLATARGDMLDVIELIEGAGAAILVDAMMSGGPAGKLVRLDVSANPLKAELATFASTHAFNLAEAIELARSLGRLPGRLIIFGVEAADFTPGAGLSLHVAAKLDEVVERIREECACTKPR